MVIKKTFFCFVLSLVAAVFASARAADAADRAFKLVVMDPLSKPLSCDCVQGYAQRDYQKLAVYLQKQLGRRVDVVWFESLAEALKETDGRADLIIGKHSVVLYDAKKLEMPLTPLARLSGRDGSVEQHGLIVVRQRDEAQSLRDLDGYRVFFGPEEAEEKCSAPHEALENAGVKLAQDCKSFNACSEAAVALLKLPAETKAAAVISSYAEPLLEGCGSVKKGDLRVVGKTKSVPFVTAFVPTSMDPNLKASLAEALEYVSTDAKLKVGLETLLGFVAWEEPQREPAKKK